MVSQSYFLTPSRRIRTTPFTSRVEKAGVRAYTVYNHMLLPTCFESSESDCLHLCNHVQVWDVSAERQVEIKGADADELVQWMTPRNIGNTTSNRCYYLPLCDESGALINDPIGIKIKDNHWWLSIADSDVLLWVKGLVYGCGLDVEVGEPEIWPLAVQGPDASTLLARIWPGVHTISFFQYRTYPYANRNWVVARTGWSGQDGFEIYVDNAEAGQALWDELFFRGEDLNVRAGGPNGIERMESGLLSYGNDMTMADTPLQCGLDKYCHLDADINSMSIEALRQQSARGIERRLVALVDYARAEMPAGNTVRVDGESVGIFTSKCSSARFDVGLAFAMINDNIAQRGLDSGTLHVDPPGSERVLHCYGFPFNLSKLISQAAKRG